MYKTARGFCAASVSCSTDMKTFLVLVLVATAVSKEDKSDKAIRRTATLATKEKTDNPKVDTNISVAEDASEKTKRGASGLSNGYIFSNGHGKLFYTQEIMDSNDGHTFSQGNYNNGGSGNAGYADLSSQFIQLNTVTRQVPVPVPQPVPVTVNRVVPVPVPAPYPVTIPRPVSVPVPQAVPITVVRSVPVTVTRHVPVPVAQPVPVPVPQTYTVPIPQAIPVHVPQPVAVPVPQPITVEVPQPVVVTSGNGAANSGAAYDSAGAGQASTFLQSSLRSKPISVIGISGHGLGANTVIAGNNQVISSHDVTGKNADYKSRFAGQSSATNAVPSLQGIEYKSVSNIAPSNHNSGPFGYIFAGYGSETNTDSSGTASIGHGSEYPLITSAKSKEKEADYQLPASTGHTDSSGNILGTSVGSSVKTSSYLSGVEYDSYPGAGILGQGSQSQYTSGHSAGSKVQSVDQSSRSHVVSSDKNVGYILSPNSGLTSHTSGTTVLTHTSDAISGDVKGYSSTYNQGSNTANAGHNAGSLIPPPKGHTFLYYSSGTNTGSSTSKGHVSGYSLATSSGPDPSAVKSSEYNLGTYEGSSSVGHTSIYSQDTSAGSTSSAEEASRYSLGTNSGSGSSTGLIGYNVRTAPSTELSSGYNPKTNAGNSALSTGDASTYDLGTNAGSLPSVGYSIGYTRSLNTHTSGIPGQVIRTRINTGTEKQSSISPASQNRAEYSVGDNSVASGHNLVYTTKTNADSKNYRTVLTYTG